MEGKRYQNITPADQTIDVGTGEWTGAREVIEFVEDGGELVLWVHIEQERGRVFLFKIIVTY